VPHIRFSGVAEGAEARVSPQKGSENQLCACVVRSPHVPPQPDELQETDIGGWDSFGDSERKLKVSD